MVGTVSDGWEGLDGRERAHCKREISDIFNLMAKSYGDSWARCLWEL